MTLGNAPAGGLCSQCLLPLGPRPTRRSIDGASHEFCCYGCCLAFQVRSGSGEESEATWLLIRLGVGGFLSMNIMMFSLLLYSGTFEHADAELLPWVHVLLWILATPVLVILGGPFLRDAWEGARRGRLTAATLIWVGVLAAYGSSAINVLVGGTHVYFETATMLLVLFTVGRYLEAAGRARAVRSLAPLLEAENQSAMVVEAGSESRRPARDLPAGTLVRVRPGERFPVDGVVEEGVSHADEAVITGESRSVAKSSGSIVIAGSVNLDGPLLISVTRAGPATRWAQICRAVRESITQKSPAQRVVDQVAGAFVPIVLVLAIATMFVWLGSASFEHALLAGLAVLVVACPCGLGLAAGLAGSLGIARLASRGCLVRGGGILESLARVRAVAIDKTGTLTLGRPRLCGIDTEGVGTDEALARAAGLERHSEHGLARGIVGAAEVRGIAPIAAAEIRAVPGLGIRGVAAGTPVAAGTGAFMAELGWPIPERLSARARVLEANGHSLVYLGWDDQVRALLWLDDTLRPEARSAVETLGRLGLEVELLTGDLPETARRVAGAIGIGSWHAALSPEGKKAALARLRQKLGRVVMVGDGLNDGPVLAAADVGVAVGSATDLARETADLVLPEDGLRLLPWAIQLARAVRRTIVTSLIWAFGYNLVALALAASGLLQPILAAALMATSSLIVILNSLRLERFAGPAADFASATPAPNATDALRSVPASAKT
jgi:Cu2+-exporting ATPase